MISRLWSWIVGRWKSLLVWDRRVAASSRAAGQTNDRHLPRLKKKFAVVLHQVQVTLARRESPAPPVVASHIETRFTALRDPVPARSTPPPPSSLFPLATSAQLCTPGQVMSPQIPTLAVPPGFTSSIDWEPDLLPMIRSLESVTIDLDRLTYEMERLC
jgi:hypothetical protein